MIATANYFTIIIINYEILLLNVLNVEVIRSLLHNI